MTVEYFAAHRANQEVIQGVLDAEQSGGVMNWLGLEVVAEDGDRAQRALSLIRSRCDHDFKGGDRDYAHQCVFCGELKDYPDPDEPEEEI